MTNYVSVQWFCDKCQAKHYGNCPKVKITVTTTEGSDLLVMSVKPPQGYSDATKPSPPKELGK